VGFVLTALRLVALDGRGILRISPIGVLALARSIRGHAFTWGQRINAAGRSLRFFAVAPLCGLLPGR
jgi:hypothetical protein